MTACQLVVGHAYIAHLQCAGVFLFALLTAYSLPPTPCLNFFSILHSHHMVHAGKPWCSRKSSRQWMNKSQRLTSLMPSSMLQSGTCSSFARYGLSSFRVVGYRRASAILKVHTVAFTAQNASISYADSLRSAIPFCSKRTKEVLCLLALYRSLPFLLKLCVFQNKKAPQVCFEATTTELPIVHTGSRQWPLCLHHFGLGWDAFKTKILFETKKVNKKSFLKAQQVRLFFELQPAFL